MLVGIIGALELEVRALKELTEKPRAERISSVDFFSGTINGVSAVVAAAGVGKVNAAVCAQTMILKYSPDIIINVGVAGGLSEDFGIGDIAVADFVAEHDMDVTALGDEKGFITGINMVKMPCDAALADMMMEAAETVGGVRAKRGLIASGDRFISTQEQRKEIINDFGAIAAEMEGGSIGHVCVMNNVPFGVLRAISDGANGNSHMDYPAFAKMAAENSVKIILELLNKIKERG